MAATKKTNKELATEVKKLQREIDLLKKKKGASTKLSKETIAFNSLKLSEEKYKKLPNLLLKELQFIRMARWWR
jgi:hypothetical protein